jgi:hypothetical protein
MILSLSHYFLLEQVEVGLILASRSVGKEALSISYFSMTRVRRKLVRKWYLLLHNFFYKLHLKYALFLCSTSRIKKTLLNPLLSLVRNAGSTVSKNVQTEFLFLDHQGVNQANWFFLFAQQTLECTFENKKN